MNSFFKNKLRINAGLLTALMALVSNLIMAGPGSGGPPPPGTPIDGGVGILALLGIGYGAKKLYSRSKEENNI